MQYQEEVELRFRNTDLPNHPGYNYPPEFRPMKISDATLLAPLMRKDGKTIGTYLGGYSSPNQWNIKDTQRWVSRSVTSSEFPSVHYLFLCGPNNVVGMGSITKFGDDPTVCQLVIAVFGKHQGKGWGQLIASTLKALAFEVWGFSAIYWLNDVTNRASTVIAQKMGFKLDQTYENKHILGTHGTGLWYRWVLERPEGLFPGVLQGANLDYWKTPKNSAMLRAVISSKSLKNQALDNQTLTE